MLSNVSLEALRVLRSLFHAFSRAINAVMVTKKKILMI